MAYKATTTTSNNTRNTSNSKTTSTTSSGKPFCRMCFDAKRPGFDTHYLKDFSGPTPVIRCPYLLDLKCNYCKTAGHTISYCDVLKEHKKADELAQKNKPTQNGHFFILRTSPTTQETNTIRTASIPSSTATKKQVQFHTKNHYHMLSSPDEEEDEVDVADVSAPVPQSSETTTSSAMTWAKIVASEPKKIPVDEKKQATTNILAALFLSHQSPPPKPILKNKTLPNQEEESVSTPVVVKSSTPPPFMYRPPAITKPWWDDSSEEEDENDE